MTTPAMKPSHSKLSRGQEAESVIAQLFASNGWDVQREPRIGPIVADLRVRKGRQVFMVEVKSLSEGRSDRVIPLLSQAILQAQAYARSVRGSLPLAVVYVANGSPSLLNQVDSFSREFAPEVSVGVVSEDGWRQFSGHGLEKLNVEPKYVRLKSPASNQAINLFSDLNQWMLKVLLAPEIAEDLLAGPRGEYRNASELALAAQASKMSASRFVQQLREEGFLDASSRQLILVRRDELFRRWRALALRPSPEVPMRFLIRGALKQQLRDLLSSHDACLGLFAAADALRLGHVMGVPPYVYVPKLPRPHLDEWRELIHASSEAPDLILREASSPQSVFRGAVHKDGIAISDVIQVWLDVSAHPSRGEEQAELIHRKVLRKIIDGNPE